MDEAKRTARVERVSRIATLIATLVAVAIAWAGSQGGAVVGGIPVFALCVGLVLLAQWFAFVPAYRQQSERFYDLTGSACFIGSTLLALVLSPEPDARSLLLGTLVIAWAFRLGGHLVRRIRRVGRDDRFDVIKPLFWRFLLTWPLQGLWVALTAGPALAAITGGRRAVLGPIESVGLVLWLGGFALESLADRQKVRFRADPANAGRFIRDGLWAWSRHPNYFGEIVLWLGVALIAAPVLQGWQLVTLVSPVFVAFLLIRVSGVPLLERKADATWGGQPDYVAYKASTPTLIPRPPRH